MKSLTAKSVCAYYPILKLWQFTGVSSFTSSDLGTNFVSQLRVNLKVVWVAHLDSNHRITLHPCFYRSRKRRGWQCKQKLLQIMPGIGTNIYCETTGVPPYKLAIGHLPRGPLAILKESWCGERHLPLVLVKVPTGILMNCMKNFI